MVGVGMGFQQPVHLPATALDGVQQKCPLLSRGRAEHLGSLLEVDLPYLPIQLDNGVEILLGCLAYFQWMLLASVP